MKIGPRKKQKLVIKTENTTGKKKRKPVDRYGYKNKN
jgi:hypothetical protein